MRAFSREDFFDATRSIPSPNRERERRAKFRWNSLCKPIGSFGMLETTVTRLAGLSPGDELVVKPRAVFVFRLITASSQRESRKPDRKSQHKSCAISPMDAQRSIS